jgi:hypothetical protein
VRDIVTSGRFLWVMLLFVVQGKRDDPLLTVYARQLVEKIATISSKPLLLSIALSNESRGPEHFQQILNKVLEIGTW